MKQTRKNTNTNKNKNKKSSQKTFSKKDYASGDGMMVKIWGPLQWTFLHTMSFNYPVHPTSSDKTAYRNYVLNLQNVLPCKHCRINLKNNLKKKPLQMCHMKNRDSFSRYIYELHETVNTMLNKKSNLTFCQVRDRYENFRSRCTEEKPKVFQFRKTDTTRKNGKKKEKEKGCTEPLYGKKSKCVINIVPVEDKTATFQMDKKCIKTRDATAAAAE